VANLFILTRYFKHDLEKTILKKNRKNKKLELEKAKLEAERLAAKKFEQEKLKGSGISCKKRLNFWKCRC